MKFPNYQKLLAITILIISFILFLMGNVRIHKVYDTGTAEYGILAFHRISERQLVIDSTFSGVLRKGEKLVSTYDRSQPVGKRPCPT